MTKEESILFCKLAVHNNFVNAADANAVLREATAARGDVREYFLQRRLLDEATCAKIMRGVAARAGKPVGAHAAARGRGRGEEHHAAAGLKPERRAPAKPLSNNQIIAAIVGSFVFLLCIVYVVYVLVSAGAHKEDATAEKPGPAVGATAPGTPGSAAPGTPAPAPAPPKSEQISEEYKKAIEQALNDAISDATTSITGGTMGPMGLASLDGWKKKYGTYATAEQMQRYQERRDQLINAIKRKFESDKTEIVAARQKGETGKVAELRRDIAKYADEATLAELESLLK